MDESFNSKLYLQFWQSLTRVDTYNWDGEADSPTNSDVPDGKYIVIVTDNVMDAENWGILVVTIKDNNLSIVEDISPPDAIHSWEANEHWMTVQELNELNNNESQKHPRVCYGIYEYPAELSLEWEVADAGH